MKTKINSALGIFAVTLLSLTGLINAQSKGAPAAPLAQSADDVVFAQAQDGVPRLNQPAPLPAAKKIEQVVAKDVSGPSPNVISAGTYGFTSGAGTLEDMSSGTTLLLAADNDDNNSALAPIGFDFWFDGVRQTLFSTNANGIMRLGVAPLAGTNFSNSVTDTTVQPSIIPYWDDLWLGNNGKIHYKVVGSAPTRKLVVEWQNEHFTAAGAGVSGTMTFQAWLYESTGVIEFVYGAIPVGASYSVGIASSATSFASVTTPANTVSYVTANNTNTSAITSGTKLTFTPNTPLAPGALSYTAVGLNTMTLNWADNATNEVGYAIYRSVDGGTTYEFIAQTAANATSYVATGLASNTTYFWQVNAVTEGAVSAAAARPTQPNTVSQATTTGTLSGTQTVGPTGTYSTITAAVTAINTSGLAGNLVLELQAAYTSGGETFPLVINACGSPSNTITIRPESGATGLSITSANTTATLDLNGATAPFGPTNVIIDGRAGGAGPSQLTIANTATAGVAVRLINGASRNTIQFCTITGVNTSTTQGVVLFSTSGAVAASNVTGNNNNNINNCDVKDGATTPVNGITSIGSASTALLNTGNTISNNTISNFFNATTATTRGINVTLNTNTSNTRWTISNNRLFQTAPRTYTVTNTVTGILISGGHDYIVSGNVVGFANSAGTGTFTMTGAVATGFTGISLAPGTSSSTTSVQGNTVAGISLTTTNGNIFALTIGGGSANIGTVTGNTIGSGTGTGSITATSTTSGAFIIGLNVNASAGTGSVNVSNNTIGSLTATGSPATINPNVNAVQLLGGQISFTNNLIGSTTTANSIQTTTVGTSGTGQQILGITAGTTMPLNISNNTIANLTNAGTGTLHVIRGISSAAPGVLASASAGKASIVSNAVNNLTGSNANTNFFATAGILLSCGTGGAPFGGLIDQNTVNTIKATNAGAVATTSSGISLTGASATVGVTGAVISTNKVYDIRNASTGTTATTPPIAVGIDAIFATTFGQTHNNMVSLGNAQTTNTEFIGILHPASNTGTLRTWFNSVHIEGAAAAGALPSYCFLRGDNSAASAVTTPVDIKNNILNNTRTGGTGKHYAIGNVNTTPATGWGAGASNNNVLNSAVAGTVGIWGLAADQTFAGWKSISSCDGSSLSGASVVFVDPANGDLHVNFGVTPTPLESGGTAVAGVTVDFDNQTRPGPAGSVNGGATAPDIGADEFDGVPLDITAPSISYTLLSNTISTANRAFNPVIVTDANGVNIAPGTRPRVYYKKSSDATNNFIDNTPATHGWKFAEASGGGGSPFSFIIDYSLLFGGSASGGDTIQYFVVAQDLATPTPNVGINAGTFTATPSSVALTPAAFPIGGSINSYNILAAISGTKNIGLGGGSDYATLTAAINDLNAKFLNGSLTLVLNDPTYPGETYPIIINANVGSSSSNTITIKPASGVSPTLSGASASAMIIINGADYVTIDGNNGGSMRGGVGPNVPTRDMVINDTVASGAVIWLQTTGGADPATNCTIKNTNLVGNTNTTTLIGVGSGGTTISAASLGTNNNNNTFQNNNISKAQYGIYSQGASAANKNTGNTITQNVMNTASPNQVSKGILVGFEDGITISQNVISNLSGSLTSYAYGISLGLTSTTISTTTGNEVTNATVSRNTIGNVRPSSTFGVAGIMVASATSGTTRISNNMVSDANTNGTFGDIGAGIYIGGGTGSTTQIYFNSVTMGGTLTGGSYPSFAVAINGSNPTVDMKNNILTATGSTGANLNRAIGLAYSTFTNLTSNYNDLLVSGTGSAIGQTGTLSNSGFTASTTLSDWITNTGKDTPNSISADPGFVSTTDLHLALNSSPAANAGTLGTGITVDIDGDSRSLIKPDIGADEILSNKLATLVLSTVPISFSPTTFTYTPTVAHNVTSTTVTPTVQDSNATITVNAVTVASGGTSAPIALAVGNTVITIVVTPEFGSAQTYTVTVTRAPTPVVTAGADSGPGTLRQALLEAVDGDVITFGSFRPAGGPKTDNPLIFSAVVTLTSAELVIDKNLVIDGGGASLTLVTRSGGAPAFRIFHVMPGHSVTIMRLSITNGAATGAAGGAIFNESSGSGLTVDRCAITGNSADTSGAIQNSGTLVMLGSLVADNNAAGDGGGMRNDGTMKITNSTISTNHANGAGSDGGGILNGLARTLSMGNCTVFKNTAGHDGGGINSAGTLTYRNSIIAYNTAGHAGNNMFKGAGTATSGDYNLTSGPDTVPVFPDPDDGAPFFTGAHDLKNADPMLSPRGNSGGGQTEAYAPLVNSPAIDQGKDMDADGNPTSTDQREGLRPVNDTAVPNALGGDGSDIGAVELGIGSHPIDAASMKQHGPGGPVYPILLPLGGLPGVECRSGGAAGVYQILIRFSTAITFTSGAAGAQVTNGTGSVTGVSRPEFIEGPNGSGTNVTIDLTGVTNAQTITVALLNVNGAADNDIGVRMGMLIGDTDGNRLTNSTDVSSVQFESGHTLTGPLTGNYRNDVTASGEINSSDVSETEFRSGTGLLLP